MARTFSILGDSISTFDGWNPAGFDVFYSDERLAKTGVTRVEQTWWHMLISHFGGTLLKNGSFSGSLVEGGFFPAGDSERRVAALAGDDGQVPDVIICFIGINDYGWGGARMNADGHGSACPPELAAQAPEEPIVAGLAPANQAEVFRKAYANMLARMQHAFPQAEIWCATLLPGRVAGREKPHFVYDFRGVPFAVYNDCIRDVARAAGAHIADAAALGMDYESIEGTHPTARGMRQIAGMIGYSMAYEHAIDERLGTDARGLATLDEAELPEALLAQWDDPRAWRSKPLCENSPCSDCPHASSAHNAWLLTCNK